MDKQTLSHYGWIVVMVLCLSVMLALATPLGHFVGDGVVSIANGFVGTSTNAMKEDSISSMEDKWMDKLNSGTQSSSGKKYNYGDSIEYNGYLYTYYGCETLEEYIVGYIQTNYYYRDKVTLSDQEALDSFVNECFGYENYNTFLSNGKSMKDIQNYCAIPDDVINLLLNDEFYGPITKNKGWCVEEVADKTKTSYPELTALDGHPVMVMNKTFKDCVNMVEAPKIPDTVIFMDYAFAACSSLSVISEIPSGVQYMNYTFTYCSSLSGSIVCHANPIQYYNTFTGTYITEILGDTTMEEELLPNYYG